MLNIINNILLNLLIEALVYFNYGFGSCFLPPAVSSHIEFHWELANEMHSLETRVHGLELALDEISYDLAVYSGRMTNAVPTEPHVVYYLVQTS